MNRKQRRAQASSKNIQTADDIPLAQPDRKKGTDKTKTLYEIAAERQATLLPQAQTFTSSPTAKNVVNVKISPDGKIIREDGSPVESDEGDVLSEDEAVPPILDTLFLATSLSALHFTLEVLTVHQYAQELTFKPIIKRTILVAFPSLFLLIHLFRGHLFPVSMTSLSPRLQKVVFFIRQLSFILIANWAGCNLIQLTNDKGYYAVMKNAPSIGTVWVWAVLEMGLIGALTGVVGPGIYAWYWGYSIV